MAPFREPGATVLNRIEGRAYFRWPFIVQPNRSSSTQHDLAEDHRPVPQAGPSDATGSSEDCLEADRPASFDRKASFMEREIRQKCRWLVYQSHGLSRMCIAARRDSGSRLTSRPPCSQVPRKHRSSFYTGALNPPPGAAIERAGPPRLVEQQRGGSRRSSFCWGACRLPRSAQARRCAISSGTPSDVSATATGCCDERIAQAIN